jgi:eukaryotic-like serine/threonine-protein kinase
MALTPGMKLGPYEITGTLGAGGMGEVYRARDTRLDRTVAIKVLPAHLSSSPELRQRFEREARAISALNHPNICTLHDIGHQDGTDFLVLEFLEGDSLADRLRKGPLPIEQALEIGIQIGDALSKAHKKGIIHRDLKSGNIMLTKSGAKLMDFGLAKPAIMDIGANAGSSASPMTPSTPTLSVPALTSAPAALTQQGTIVGTFLYMAPELLQGHEADVRSDIFGFGCVLYEMVAGRRPFEGKSQLSVLAAILEKEPEPLARLQPMTNPALEHAVLRCLAKDPEQRWQCASDVASELKWVKEAGPQLSVSTSEVSRWKLREYVFAAAAVLLALTTFFLGVAYFRHPLSDARSVRVSILPPENTSFMSGILDIGYALSPDGTRLAFVAQSASGKTSLWVRPLDSLTAQALAGTDNASHPFWSPDSQWIGFFSLGKLRKTPASGGPVQEICDAPLGRGGTWNAQGTIVFAPSIISPLFRISANGGTAVPATKLDSARGETTHRWPDFLPDGVHFLYLGRSISNDRTASVYVGSLDSSPPKRILEGTTNARYAWPGYLVFLRGSTLLAQRFAPRSLTLLGEAVPIAADVAQQAGVIRSSVDVSQTGQLIYQGLSGSGDSELKITDRTGKQISVLGSPGNFAGIRISSDGQRAAIVDWNSVEGNGAIWLYDLRTNLRTRFTFASGRNFSPVWSPDGSQLAFASGRSGTSNMYVKPTTGASEEKRLIESTDDQRPMSWSPDGRYLAFENRGSAAPQIYVLPIFGDRKPFPLLNASYPTFAPQFSPDGHWLVYVSLESGQLEVFVTSFPEANGKWQVSSQGGNYPRWRHDGREIFYVASDGTIMAAEVTMTGGSFSAGAVKQLSDNHVLQGALVTLYDVFPDGQRFIMSAMKPEAAHAPLTLVTNWPAALLK